MQGVAGPPDAVSEASSDLLPGSALGRAVAVPPIPLRDAVGRGSYRRDSARANFVDAIGGQPALSLDAPGLVRPHRDLDAVAGADLVHQRADMGLHRAQGDVQLVGDLGVGAAAGDGE